MRLTGSGLGCPHWPGCEQQDVLPKGYHSYVEFSNRVVAFFTVMTTLALAVGSLRTRGLERRAKVLAWIVFGGTLAQAPLGAITIYFDLNPYLVISHLLLSLVVIGVAVLVLLDATQLLRGVGTAFPAAVRALGGLLLAAITFSSSRARCRLLPGKFPGSNGNTKVHRLGAFEPAVSLHVKAVATFGIVFLLLAAWALRNRSRYPWLVPGCAGLLAILLAQMAIGETQYRTYGTVPWWLVLIHVTVAAVRLCLDGRPRRPALAAGRPQRPRRIRQCPS